jgi:hypothetical protein
MIRILLVLLFLSGFYLPGFSQLEQSVRSEIELDKNDEYFNVVSAENKGLVLYREANVKTRGKTKGWEIVYLDTDLKTRWKEVVFLDFEYQLIGYEYNLGHFFLLFEHSNFSKKEYLIVRVSLEEKLVNQFIVDKVFQVELRQFEVHDDHALFVGIVNLKPAVILYSFTDDQVTVLPGVYSNLNSLVNVVIDDQSRTITVILNEKTYRKNITFIVKTYSLDGKLLRTIKMDPGPEYSLLDGEITSFERDVIWISGTYATRRSKYSRGMFIAQLSNTGQDNISFINYADFKNFFRYMRDRREDRIYEKIERRREKGKKLKFNYRVLVHEIIEKDDEYVVVGEAYYPRYTPPSSYYGGINQLYRSRYGEMAYFDGYRYTHAVVFGFNKNGKVLWDNCFEIKDVVTYDLEQYVHVNDYGDKMVLLYTHDGMIQSKIISGNAVIDGKSDTEIKTSYPSDEVRNNDDDYGDLVYWYEDYFYVYGAQSIRNMSEGGVDLNRKVFYVNKVYYSEDQD